MIACLSHLSLFSQTAIFDYNHHGCEDTDLGVGCPPLGTGGLVFGTLQPAVAQYIGNVHGFDGEVIFIDIALKVQKA